MNPRSFKPIANVLKRTYEIMLAKHPLAFDCIIFPARDSEFDEIRAVNPPEIGLLDRDERKQAYDPPEPGRAMIIPNNDLLFGMSESSNFESFTSAYSDAINMLVSRPGLRTFSFIQWTEFLSLDSGETVERIVYVAEVKPIGRTLNAGVIYVCRPLLASGEAPQEPLKLAGGDPAKFDSDDIGVW